MNEELLLSLVKEYKELYDPSNARYHDEQRRNNIWQEIGEVMKETRKYLLQLNFIYSVKKGTTFFNDNV